MLVPPDLILSVGVAIVFVITTTTTLLFFLLGTEGVHWEGGVSMWRGLPTQKQVDPGPCKGVPQQESKTIHFVYTPG